MNQYRGSADDPGRGWPVAPQVGRRHGLLLQPVRPDALDVVLDQPGGVRVAAVDDAPASGPSSPRPSRSVKSAASTTIAFEPAGHQSSSTSRRWRAKPDREDTASCGTRPAGCRPRATAARPPRADRHLPQVERDAEAEDEQQQAAAAPRRSGSCSGRGRSAAIPCGSGPRCRRGRPDRLRPRGGHGRASPPCRSNASTSAMNASSSVGSGAASALAASFSSSGEPWR